MSDEARHPEPAEEVIGGEPAAAEIELDAGPEAAPGAPPTAAAEAQGSEPAAAETEIQALREDLLRARADFDNYRKRQERERGEISRFAAAQLVEQLLPVLDNFERALDAGSLEAASLSSFREGIALIHRQLTEILARAGLSRIRTAGQPFDPAVHEAVIREETTGVEQGMVVAELEPGYLFRDRLLKPARVKVAVPPGS